MRILVTFAVDAEFAPWRKVRDFVVRDDNFCKVHVTRFGDVEVNILLTGIGGKSAWVETTKRVWDGDIDVCISSGLAGALRAEHRPGDILTPQSIWLSASSKSISCDPALRRWAVQAGAREVEAFYSADTVILSAGEKQRLGKDADAVEMESGEVLYEAAAFGARVVAIRGISDAAEEDLPLDFNRVTTSSGEVSMGRVLGQVARNLGKVPSLIRFGKQSRAAAEKLCQFLDRYLEGLENAVPEIAKEAAK
jgi:adenosylhomocysteine nucleosidase